MKKLLISLMIFCSFGLYAQQDVTGTWRSADGWKAEFIQDGIHVYAILNVSNFKHFIMATINGNQIRGTILRYDVNNNCNTAMDGTWTLSGNNSMQLTWKDLDGRCDLGLNQTGTDAPLTRVSRPSELPMNGFGGSRFDPNSDATGSWGDADWIQLGTLVYFINNNSGFKHYFMGSRNGNQITGTQTRINRSNGCLTEMNMTFTLTNANSMQYRAVARDGRCDLQLGWSESGTITRRGTNGTVPPAVQAGTYTLTNKNSNLCLAVRGATQNNGEEGTQWACDGNADKNWKIIDAGGGFYKLQNENSNHFLAVGAGSRDQGGRVVQYVDQGQEDILWRLLDIGDGYYKVQNKNSGLFLAIGAGSREGGANLVQWGDAGQEDVKWKLDKLFIRPFPIDIAFVYTMARAYPNPNFGGTEVAISTVGRKTVAELGTVSSIKVAWGYKAIVTYESAGKKGAINTNQMEIVGDREILPIISGTGASAGRSSVTAIEIVAYTPLNGFVDMHTHPMSHLGFGGKLMHGAPDIGILVPAIPNGDGCRHYERAANINEALASCRSTHGGYGVSVLGIGEGNTCGDELRKAILRGTEGNLHARTGHHEEGARGFPSFVSWPAQNDITHQQMWIDWIKRTYQNGLRVMVALTVNNATLAAAVMGPGDRNGDDVASSNIQIDEMKRMVARHNGSAGSVDNWMDIAYSSTDVRRIIESGRLAVILGMEVDNIGNFNKNTVVDAYNLTAANTQTVRNEIQRVYNQGVRYIFPIHLVDNKFGGTAIYEDMFNLANYHQTGRHWDIGCAAPSDGITKQFTVAGFDAPLALAKAKIGVDIFRNPPTPPTCGGHVNNLGLTPLGEFAVKEIMKLGMIIDIDHMSKKSMDGTFQIAQSVSNGGYPLNAGHNGIRGSEGSERSLDANQARTMMTLGGVIGVGCSKSRADEFNQNFVSILNTLGASNARLAIGTDINGFEQSPRPRPGSNIQYTSAFPICQTGSRSWDYNREGVAHYGLLPDFLKDANSLSSHGILDNHLMRSAEYFAQMWGKCERQRANIR